MSEINIAFVEDEYSRDTLVASIARILDTNILCSIATLKGKESYIHTAYYCFGKELDIYFISDPATQHTENINANASVAVAICDSRQPWDNNKRGLQIFGDCKIASGMKLAKGTMLYLKRFAGLREWIKHPDDFVKGAINSKMFVITPHSLKLFDEDTFGEEVFISLTLNQQRG